MTDSHETNHAAEAGSRHADGVRSAGLSNEQALRKWALQTILLSPHPMPSSWADLEQASNRYVLFVLTGSSIRPKIGSVINASFGGRRVQAGNENVSTFKGFQNLGLRTLQFGNAAFQFFRSRLHKRSSPFSGLNKQKMDDGGRHGNVSPDSFTVRSPENANAGDTPEKPLRPEDIHMLESVTYPVLFQELAKRGFTRTLNEAKWRVWSGDIWVNGLPAKNAHRVLIPGDIVRIIPNFPNQHEFTVGSYPAQDETQVG